MMPPPNQPLTGHISVTVMMMKLLLLLCLESLSDNETHMFLLILYQLVPQLSVTSTRRSAADVDDSDSDDDAMDVDHQVHLITSTTLRLSLTVNNPNLIYARAVKRLISFIARLNVRASWFLSSHD